MNLVVCTRLKYFVVDIYLIDFMSKMSNCYQLGFTFYLRKHKPTKKSLEIVLIESFVRLNMAWKFLIKTRLFKHAGQGNNYIGIKSIAMIKTYGRSQSFDPNQIFAASKW